MLAKSEILEDEYEFYEFFTDDNNHYQETNVILDDHDEYINNILSTYGDYNDVFKKLDNIHFNENRYCSLYLGEYIERYIINYLGGEIVPIETEYKVRGRIRRPADFILDYHGTKIKVKHVAGCLIYGQYGNGLAFYWDFSIDFNYDTDAFLLSAWDTRKSLILQHMWLIMRDEKFGNLPFWRRKNVIIRDIKDRISQMEKYEMKVDLGKLQNMLAHVKKEDAITLLIDKQRDIYMETDIKINLKRLARIALLHGLKWLK